MASDKTPAPAPAGYQPQSDRKEVPDWEPPTSDQEFKFESVQKAPSWVDKGWASFDRGPALAVPMGNLDGTGPYHTTKARVGDIVKYIAPVGATPGHMEVIASEPEPGKGTKRPAQYTNASLEDLLRLGWIDVGDLGEDAKSQVAARTPGLKKQIEEGKGGPKKQNVSDMIKT